MSTATTSSASSTAASAGSRNHFAWLPALLLALQLLVTATIAFVGGDELRYADEADYNGLALRLDEGRGYVDKNGEPTAFRAPGYPLLLAAIYQVSSRPLAAKLVNAALLLAATLLLTALVAPLAPNARWSVPLLVLLSPLLLYSAGTLYPQVFALFLLVLCLYLTLRQGHRPSMVVLAGLAYGLLILAVSSFLMLLPLLCIGLVWAWPGSLLRRFALAAAFAIAAAAVMLPWIARNHQVFGVIVPGSTNGGLNLLIGNSENTKPNNGVNADISRYRDQTAGMNEVKSDAFFRDQAIVWIKAHTADAAILYGQKTLNYFNFRNEVATPNQSSRWADAVLFVSYYPMLLLAVWRLVVWRRMPLARGEALLYALYVGNALLSAIFFTRLRFRVPFDALLIAAAAMAFDRLIAPRVAARQTRFTRA